MTYKNLIETKDGQLQQIRENEARREAEREMERMWHDLMMKEYQARVSHCVNSLQLLQFVGF